MKKKLLIIGPYPPPYGGVSIHIKRLKPLLGDLFEIDIMDEARIKKENIFNIRSFKIGSYLSKIFNADIVHIHSGLFFFRAVHFSVAGLFFKKKIITIHGYEPGRSFMERTFDKMMLRNCSKTIFVSKEIAERLKVKKYLIKDAFLPPDINDEAELPAEVSGWVEDRKSKGYSICSANAWRLDSHNNEDMYGLDLCIMAAQELKSKKTKAAFVFVVCEDTGKIKCGPYRKMITDLSLEDCFLLYEAPLSFIKLVLKSDMIIRPTNTDGDALTVREGLFFRKNVIASDVVARPEGTKLFKNRDARSLAFAIREVKDATVNTSQQEGHETINNPASVKDFYVNYIYNL